MLSYNTEKYHECQPEVVSISFCLSFLPYASVIPGTSKDLSILNSCSYIFFVLLPSSVDDVRFRNSVWKNFLNHENCPLLYL